MKKTILAVLAGLFLGSAVLAMADDAPVNQRLENQQDRIQQGVKSGELTKKEARHLRRQERRMRKEVREQREDNGGKLTAKEKRHDEKQLNKESRRIYRKKHNDRKREEAK